jgi:PAS domain S-box-containing protein
MFNLWFRNRPFLFYANVGVIDADGKLVCSAVPLSGPVDLSDRDYFQQALSARDLSIGQFEVERSTGKSVVNFGYPVIDKAGKVRAALFVALDLGYFNTLAACADMPIGASVTLMDAQGTILSRYPDPEKWVGHAAQDVEIVKMVQERNEGLAEAVGVDGVAKIYGFKQLGQTQRAGFLYVGIPRAFAYANANQTVLRSIAALPIAALAGLAALWGLAYLFVMKGVNRVIATAGEIAAGNFKARAGVPIAHGEMGKLFRSFDDMAEALQARDADRRKAEENLIRERQFSEQMINGLPGMFYLFDENMRFLRWNANFGKVTGYSDDEIRSLSPLDIFTGDHKRIIEEGIAEVFAEGEAFREAELTAKDDTRRPYLFSGKLLSIDEKRYLTGLGLDISDRKRVEDSLARSERLMKTILATLPVGVDLAEGRRIKWANEAWRKMFGFSDESEYICRGARMLYPDDQEYERAGRAMYDRLDSGAPTETEAVLMRRDGSTFNAVMITNRVYPEHPSDLTAIVVVTDISERKRAEAELRRRESTLRSILAASPVGICLTEKQRIRWASEPLLKMLGFSDEVSLLDRPTSIMHVSTDVYKSVMRRLYESLEAGEVGEADAELRRMDGSAFHANIRIARADPGSPTGGTICAISDISDRKAAEARIRDQNQFLHSLLESVTHAFYVVDPNNYTVIMANSAARKAFADGAITCFAATHRREEPCNAEAHPCPVEQIIRTREPVTVEHVHYDCDGNERTVEINAYPVLGDDQTIKCIVEYVVDITERKRSEVDRLRLMTAVEQAAETIIITDNQGKILQVNPAFEQTSGYSREEAIGKMARFPLMEGKQEGIARQVWDSLQQGLPWKGRLVNRKKDGSLYHEDCTISPIKDECGRIVNYVAVKRDVTPELALEKQLFHAQKLEAIGTLAGGIAHDFNNILSIIMGYIDMLMAHDLPQSDVENYLKRIAAAGERATDLVRQILTFSRKTDHEKKPTLLAPLVKETIKFLQASVPKTVKISFDVPEGIEPVMGDPTQIHQVLMNLCTNALHSMRDAGGVLAVKLAQVEIGAEASDREADLPAGNYTCLTVSDTGGGIRPDILDRIFEPYFTTKSLGEGTGLGLAVVQGIVASHDGTIRVESEPGKGSVFQVFFPAIHEDTLSDSQHMRVMRRGNELILFVDDEPDIANVVKKKMEGAGYRVVSATSPVDALDLFRRRPDDFDVVVTDFNMPGMTGKELALELLKIRPDLPIVLCTGLEEIITPEAARSLGIREYVLKPFRIHELASTIRRVLESPRDARA